MLSTDIDQLPTKRKRIALETVINAFNEAILDSGQENWIKCLKKYKTVQMVRYPRRESKFDSSTPIVINHNSSVTCYNSAFTISLGEIRGIRDFNRIKAKKWGNWELASFCIGQLQTCCAVGILSSAHVDDNLRGKGLGTLLHDWKLYICENKAAYSSLICSVITGRDWWRTTPFSSDDRLPKHSVQEHILEKAGWTRISHAFNPKSDNNVGVYTIALHPSEHSD
jgi:hypothetical protein